MIDLFPSPTKEERIERKKARQLELVREKIGLYYPFVIVCFGRTNQIPPTKGEWKRAVDKILPTTPLKDIWWLLDCNEKQSLENAIKRIYKNILLERRVDVEREILEGSNMNGILICD